MTDAVIVAAVRTPIGRGRKGGALAGVHPVDLLARSIEGVLEETGVPPEMIDDVIAGCVTQAGPQGANVARTAALAAGLPESVPGVTVDRQCGSSQQAVAFAAQGVISGAYDVVIACGVESMSQVPIFSDTPPDADPYGRAFAGRYPDGMVNQGVSAELIAARWNLTRAELDEFALASHAKAAAAWDAGAFEKEVLPCPELAADEGVRRDTSAERLAALPAAFHSAAMAARFPQLGWSVTAGNSSQISDGSAALLITSSDTAARLGLIPLARVHTAVAVGDDPLYKLTAPIPATRAVLAKAGLGLSDIDLFEVSEAFASVVLAWARETGADMDRVNVHGGGISLGHPLGASGARLMTTLVHGLVHRGGRYGLQVMCEAGGVSNATIVERIA
ncbi:acetyl-CoA C-acyltransferase [Actinomadura geliboluensis]|uniref:acetyl-CoA C-acyltransferase n=1 Tax=Actinomadura geliboluensis TaxID=882440 RepID=UPI00197AA7E7|nr:acetyl-CoA C-acyltransferase [Actinomadura geliboluensis]